MCLFPVRLIEGIIVSPRICNFKKMTSCEAAVDCEALHVACFLTFSICVTLSLVTAMQVLMLVCFQGRISQDFEHFLIAPFGMLHHEVTACSLVKVDMRGDVLDVGASGIGLGVNKLGFSLHAAAYASRPDIKCIVHLRCPSAVAVSCRCIATCGDHLSVSSRLHHVVVACCNRLHTFCGLSIGLSVHWVHW